MALGAADQPGDRQAEDRQDRDTGDKLIGRKQRAGGQNIGADAILRADQPRVKRRPVKRLARLFRAEECKQVFRPRQAPDMVVRIRSGLVFIAAPLLTSPGTLFPRWLAWLAHVPRDCFPWTKSEVAMTAKFQVFANTAKIVAVERPRKPRDFTALHTLTATMPVPTESALGAF
jgi:hypothetical protein